MDRSYEVLGIKPGTSQEEIKQVYHELVKVWHPDRFAHDARLQVRAQEKLKEINEAYEAVMSPHIFTSPPRPGRSQPPTQPQQPRPKDKYWMMPWVSFITLVIALALISMIFHIYGRPFEPVHVQKTLQEPT